MQRGQADILLVEPDEDLAEMFSQHLESSLGAQVRAVDTAAAASQGTAQYFVGYALKDSSAEDQLIPVVVWPMRVDNPAP